MSSLLSTTVDQGASVNGIMDVKRLSVAEWGDIWDDAREGACRAHVLLQPPGGKIRFHRRQVAWLSFFLSRGVPSL